MNPLFEEEIRPLHAMRDHLLTVVTDDDLHREMPGWNPTLAGQLVEMGQIQGAYTHSFETGTLDWDQNGTPPPEPSTLAGLRAWFDAQDAAMKAAVEQFAEDQLQQPHIDRGGGFVASPFVQVQVYREAVYIQYGKLSVYLRALERDPGQDWATGIG